jgi:hypothetical protein
LPEARSHQIKTKEVIMQQGSEKTDADQQATGQIAAAPSPERFSGAAFATIRETRHDDDERHEMERESFTDSLPQHETTTDEVEETDDIRTDSDLCAGIQGIKLEALDNLLIQVRSGIGVDNGNAESGALQAAFVADTMSLKAHCSEVFGAEMDAVDNPEQQQCEDGKFSTSSELGTESMLAVSTTAPSYASVPTIGAEGQLVTISTIDGTEGSDASMAAGLAPTAPTATAPFCADVYMSAGFAPTASATTVPFFAGAYMSAELPPTALAATDLSCTSVSAIGADSSLVAMLPTGSIAAVGTTADTGMAASAVTTFGNKRRQCDVISDDEADAADDGTESMATKKIRTEQDTEPQITMFP